MEPARLSVTLSSLRHQFIYNNKLGFLDVSPTQPLFHPVFNGVPLALKKKIFFWGGGFRHTTGKCETPITSHYLYTMSIEHPSAFQQTKKPGFHLTQRTQRTFFALRHF